MIASVHRALKPGGRFVAELGGAGCVQTVRLALIDAANRRGLDGAALDPWFFPTEAAYRALLEAHGFEVRAITLFPRPTPLPGDITDWLETFAQPFLGAVPAGERAAFLQDVRGAVQPALFDAARGWTADYIRLRFDARKTHDRDGDATDRHHRRHRSGIDDRLLPRDDRRVSRAAARRQLSGDCHQQRRREGDARRAGPRASWMPSPRLLVVELERLARPAPACALLAANSPHIVFDEVVAPLAGCRSSASSRRRR